MLLYGLAFDDEYDHKNRLFWWVVYNIIGQSLFGGVTRISEGGYTIEYNSDAWLRWYNYLANIWGFPSLDDFNAIENRTNQW